jgi:nicotinamide mononucleotide transporter
LHVNDLWQLAALALAALDPWELLGVGFGLAYLLLAARESLLCWSAAFFSTAISIKVFWNAALVMESALQVYYLFMAVYGFLQWRQAGEGMPGLPVSTWPLRTHLGTLGGVLLAALATGAWLEAFTDAAWPYLNSLSAWASVVTTWMVARKILENWLYWLAIDSISIFLYVQQGLHLYALLFVVYLVIAAFGYRAWLLSLRGQAGWAVAVVPAAAAEASASRGRSAS